MNSMRSKDLSLKNQRFTPSGCKDIWIRLFEKERNISKSFNPFKEEFKQTKLFLVCLNWYLHFF